MPLSPSKTRQQASPFRLSKKMVLGLKVFGLRFWWRFQRCDEALLLPRALAPEAPVAQSAFLTGSFIIPHSTASAPSCPTLPHRPLITMVTRHRRRARQCGQSTRDPRRPHPHRAGLPQRGRRSRRTRRRRRGLRPGPVQVLHFRRLQQMPAAPVVGRAQHGPPRARRRSEERNPETIRAAPRPVASHKTRNLP